MQEKKQTEMISEGLHFLLLFTIIKMTTSKGIKYSQTKLE